MAKKIETTHSPNIITIVKINYKCWLAQAKYQNKDVNKFELRKIQESILFRIHFHKANKCFFHKGIILRNALMLRDVKNEKNVNDFYLFRLYFPDNCSDQAATLYFILLVDTSILCYE